MVDDVKSALVTGAGRNIGRACALALARAGYHVAINGSGNIENCERVASDVSDLGVRSCVVMGDIGHQDQLERIHAETVSNLGPVSVLVNNAAIRPKTPFLETDEETWDRILNIDFHAARRLAKLCLPDMIAQGWGRIINFAGMNAIHGYNGRAPVSVSKHAAWGLTKSLAKEFAVHGITANIVSPGPIQPEEMEAELRAHIEEMIDRVPTGRLGRSSEIADTVVFLASESGAFINGQLIQVNGGAET